MRRIMNLMEYYVVVMYCFGKITRNFNIIFGFGDDIKIRERFHLLYKV